MATTTEPTPKKKAGRKKGSKNKFKITQRPGPDQLPPLRVTPRDLAVIYSVYTHRCLTTLQINTLHFASSHISRCQARLKLLYQPGLLWRWLTTIKMR